MVDQKPLIVGGVVFAIALAAALAFESVYGLSIRTRPPDPLTAPTRAPDARKESAQAAFSLRLVDSGGVGIPLAQWGKDYSHDRRTFREVILEAPPHVDDAAFERVELEWRSYVARMLDYGNNAIAVPLLLELMDFNRVNPASTSVGVPVYDAGSPFLARHAAVRRRFGPLFDWTSRRGMQVFLDADMLTLTPPLSRALRRLAPDASVTGIDTSNPAVWDVYRAGLEELFDEMPFIAGVVIRFGEGGNLYNTADWPYRSDVAVRTAANLQAMLRGLLPLFEARHKTLVLRSWTVGVGQLGRLHVDPRVYEAVLGDIESPALIVSTKFTAGDFFSYLPLNPTLAGGRHRRIVELQAKPEFEGSGAFPDFLGEEHARALRSLRSANPRIVGTYLLPQFGGPLRAGPRTLYPLHGFWLWTDANVFVASHLAVDPEADVSQLARTWARARFGDDPRITDAVVHVLTEGRKAVLTGFYIRPFAEREVRVPGLELPPLMWIFEWDLVGGWHSLLSIVYRGSRDSVDLAIEEGYAAAASVRRARQQLQAAFEQARPGTCAAICGEALRSLEYQETLFDTLAAWRKTFLSYYRWLDTGDAKAWTGWRQGRDRFAIAAAQHVARFGSDLDFPAFDPASATQAVTAAERGAWTKVLAAMVLIGVTALVASGSPLGRRARIVARSGAIARVAQLAWTAAVTPWRLSREPVGLGDSVVATTLPLLLIGFLAATLTAFTVGWIGVGVILLFGIVALTFEATAFATGRQGRGRLLVASTGPLLPGLMVLHALIAYFGPIGFWYYFWVSPAFRIVLLTTVVAMHLWTGYAMLAARPREDWRGSVGGMAAATGAGLIVLTILLPGWADVLRALDRPLNFAPATETMLFALRTYAGVSLAVGGRVLLLGAFFLAAGFLLQARSGVRANT